MATWSPMALVRLGMLAALESVLLPWQLLAFLWLLWNLRVRVAGRPTSAPTSAHTSATADGTFLVRLMMHAAGTRPDPAAALLAPHLPGMNPYISLAAQSFGYLAGLTGLGPVLFRYQWGGGKGEPSLLLYVQQRTAFMDRMVEQAVGMEGEGGGTHESPAARGKRRQSVQRGEHRAATRRSGADWGMEGQVGQVVILGAGFDTRAWGVLKDEPVLVFELDQPATHKAKRAAIRSARLDSTKALLVRCDFNEKTWLQALLDHGFDRSVPTLIICEGVLMFLEEEAVKRTLGAVNNLAKESCIAFDLVNMEMLEGLPPFSRWYTMVRRFVGEVLGEPLLWGVSPFPSLAQNVEIFLKDLGLKIQEAKLLGGAKNVIGGFFLAVSE